MFNTFNGSKFSIYISTISRPPRHPGFQNPRVTLESSQKTWPDEKDTTEYFIFLIHFAGVVRWLDGSCKGAYAQLFQKNLDLVIMEMAHMARPTIIILPSNVWLKMQKLIFTHIQNKRDNIITSKRVCGIHHTIRFFFLMRM